MAKYMNKVDFLIEIERLYKEYGRINIGIWKKYSIYKDRNFEWLCQRFGGIKSILKELNLDYILYNETTKEEIFERAKELYNKYGYIDKILCCKNHISSSSVRRNFGNFNNLFKEIGIMLKMPRNVTKEELLEDIKKFIEETNCYSSSIYRTTRNYGEKIINNYGGWEILMKELGIEPIGNSQPERLIAKYLDDKNISYKMHYNFDWLRTENNKKMYVDFYIEDKNLVIEYDGLQHYKFVEMFHKTQENFEECIKRDKLKEKLLEEHKIKLFRILYCDEIVSKLEEILNSL